MSNQSEIARLREQIELETQAMQQALNGPSVSGSHEIINHRYDAIGQLHNQLVPLVGDEEAGRFMNDAYRRGMEGK